MPGRRRWLGLLVGAAFLLPSLPAEAQGCDQATSQAELAACARARLDQADAQLNVSYRQVLARLWGDAAATALLREAERAWLAFRDKECAFVASASAGGSAQPMILADCKAGLTEQRVEELDGYLRCAEGDLSCPMPPG